MIKLPDHINCKSEAMVHCDFYMHQLCPETCSYALDIKGLGIGATDTGIIKKLNEDAAENSTKTK